MYQNLLTDCNKSLKALQYSQIIILRYYANRKTTWRKKCLRTTCTHCVFADCDFGNGGRCFGIFETTRVIKSEQDALAQVALIRYEPIIRPLLPSLSRDDYHALTQNQSPRHKWYDPDDVA